ncbi:DUF1616 domain-containing protein [Haladaptatus sp. AB618]|uniref:DUF1616 domain-containing protein n=1 Tax=Haladaptatus sp. AB618 TaxID=2934173 RepID=UPI00209C0CA1|nr:DUF1616 domain-containing protein [Haladaptatus sp. AB618]MCO8255393.1 DUF1616 domain-containing protein [Haladaptatus sp. AB618]
MSDTSGPRRVLRPPLDLVFVGVLSVVAAAAPFVPLLGVQPIRLVVTLPLLLFLPGYATIEALFPEPATGDERFGGVERFAFAVGTSVLVVAALALALDYGGVGIRAVPVLFSTCGFTIVASAVAAIRRRTVDPERDGIAPPRFRDGLTGIRASETRLDRTLNVVLVVLILASVVSVGVALGGLGHTESYTTMSLLTKNGSTTVAADGGSRDLLVGIDNHENHRVRYTVVVQRQQVAADDPTTVTKRTPLTRFHVTLNDGERKRISYTVPPSLSGNHRRIAFLLYEDRVPATPTADNAAQETHLWVTPSNGSEGDTSNQGARG